MQTTRTTQGVIVALFLIAIAIEGPVQARLDMREEGRPQAFDLFAQPPSQDALRAFERTLEDRSWSANAVRAPFQGLRHALLGDPGAKVLPGREGWLFYRQGVDYLMQSWPGAGEGNPDDPLPAIVDFRDQLAARGVDLLIAIAPGKASMYPELLGARPSGAPVYAHTRAFQERLDAAGIAFVDLHAALDPGEAAEAPLYLKRDTHWTPEGARRAAEAVADRILAEGWATPGNVAYISRDLTVERAGDLLRMAGSPGITAAYPPERVTAQQIVDPATGALLVSGTASPVLVLGDSFLRIYEHDEPGSAGFLAHLARALKEPVASIVSDGGASTLVRQELARRPEVLRGKRLVVWEFVERDLRFGIDGWRRVSLPN